MYTLFLFLIPMLLCWSLIWFQSYCIIGTIDMNKPNMLWRLSQFAISFLPIISLISFLGHLIYFIFVISHEYLVYNKDNKFVKTLILQ